MAHTILIAAHATCGLIAFVVGILVLRPRTMTVTPLFHLYLGALLLMVFFLLLVVGFDWLIIDMASRLIFSALIILALYVGWRGWHALQILRHQATDQVDRYIDDVGFTLIALFDGFIIVFFLDLGSPIWLVVLIGLLGILIGRSVVIAVKRRVAQAV